MCGIVGYCGEREAAGIVVEGLKKLEYRGYDSFGIATIGEKLHVLKRRGRISDLEGEATALSGTTGIGHTRWATHGVPNDVNAHPHLDCQGRIAVVHNGIIENYIELRRELVHRGHNFLSETDTEVIVHLIEEEYHGSLVEAMERTLGRLEGSYAILACVEGDEALVAARYQSPLVIGLGDGENLAASDTTPLLEYTERVIYLEDGDVAVLTRDNVVIRASGREVDRVVQTIDWSVEDVRKGGFKHYMAKEIYEQPAVFSQSVRAVSQETLPEAVTEAGSVTVVACGTSYHAGMIFRYLLEENCCIPVRLELASEFKYYTPPPTDLIIGITQSGETADTLAAFRKGRCANIPTVAITNVLGSTVTRTADYTLFMRAGPEISVAATKSFTAELGVLMQVVNLLCDGRHDLALKHGSQAIEEVLLMDLSEAVRVCRGASHIFYVGRGPYYPVALEGALKMKEISYIHAEGYAAGEIKHGPFALLSEETPVVAICPPGTSYPVMISNLKEMKARGTPLVVIGVGKDQDLYDIADVYIPLPETDPFIVPVTASIALQQIAYFTADALGMDIDKPRNLAKSVTVE